MVRTEEDIYIPVFVYILTHLVLLLTMNIRLDINSDFFTATTLLHLRRMPAHALASKISQREQGKKMDEGRKEGRGECERRRSIIQLESRGTECHRDVSLTHSPCR